ncbi:including n-acetylases of ribosomal protein [Epithele typhae]|uniref:including n-acetylases of ribosomal protein n=1 Tax=Epithele typhae TaxID=378194 RepID=UPI002008A19A|nr:including n-acetylases of ribosomal protein [Epithele typhae]KAH9929612.1 including n-acetylases of ribosomal protein [Epithele typhae]
MDPNFFVETDRLYISNFQSENDDHCDFLLQLYTTPEFIASAGNSGLNTRDDARKQIAGLFTKWHASVGCSPYLVSRKPTDPAAMDGLAPDAPFQERLARCTHVGGVSLIRGTNPTSYKVPDLGFVILPEEMRKGYAKEAALGALKHLKEGLGGDVAAGFTSPKNVAAKAVFKSLGWVDRGEMALVDFGGEVSSVWLPPHAAEDLSVYGLP